MKNLITMWMENKFKKLYFISDTLKNHFNSKKFYKLRNFTSLNSVSKISIDDSLKYGGE